MAAIPSRQDVVYPGIRREAAGRVRSAPRRDLRPHLGLAAALPGRSGRPRHGRLFLYYVEGNPRAVVCPDVFVAKGVSKEQRRIYKLWEEGQVPCLVIEVTSESTRNEDFSKKKDLYERLGVEEYILHDPLGEYLRPSSRASGWREGSTGGSSPRRTACRAAPRESPSGRWGRICASSTPRPESHSPC